MRSQIHSALQDRFNSLQTQIEEIKSRSDQVLPQYLLEFERQLDLLFAKHNLAVEKLARMPHVDDVEWEEMKASLDGICNEIENALDSAFAKIG